MEKELNDGAEAGFRFQAVMGGDTAGGSEVVVVMARRADVKAQVAYRLLATSKTSTMEVELRAAAEAGFEYRGQTVFKSAFGGRRSCAFWNAMPASGRHGPPTDCSRQRRRRPCRRNCRLPGPLDMH